SILLNLSVTSGVIPSSLFLKRVQCDPGAHAVSVGGFADIFSGLYDGCLVALKRIRVFLTSGHQQELKMVLCQEALAWRQLKHPRVVPFLGVDGDSHAPALCMVSPWMSQGSLLKYLIEHEVADDSLITLASICPLSDMLHLLILSQQSEIIEGLAYLHDEEDTVHGDLRCSNVFIDEAGHAQLCDFGLASLMDIILTTAAEGSSARWAAPELHDPDRFGDGEFRRTRESDVYAFGCMCLEMYTLRPPFHEIPRDITVILRVLEGARPPRPSAEQGHARPLPDEMWILMQACWSTSPAERPTVKMIASSLQKLRSLAPTRVVRLLMTSLSSRNVPVPSVLEHLTSHLQRFEDTELISSSDFELLTAVAQSTWGRSHLAHLAPRLPGLVCKTFQDRPATPSIDDMVHPWKLAAALVRYFRPQCGPAWSDMALAITRACRDSLLHTTIASDQYQKGMKAQSLADSFQR
ncbi:kinase-like protein, partial [Punctularia strigosozonata HHB-11173 SS5]|uniref:kinase-like protein n=1 Tax=Punctularia strigosozonata (strain HHB-11173) TaxID=741275 RepID=UPI0004416E21